MLASSFKFTVRNDSGISVSGVIVDYYPWKYGTDGTLTYGTPEQFTSGAVGNASSGDIGTVANGVNKNLGAHLDITFPATPSATGDLKVYLVTQSADQETETLVAVTNIESQKIFQAEI